ncbi:MAG: DnaJ family molecular chaperone [Verrucomicrobiia bacterium]
MRQYHPDNVASLGPELRELAERKAKQINEAFRTLAQQRSTA